MAVFIMEVMYILIFTINVNIYHGSDIDHGSEVNIAHRSDVNNLFSLFGAKAIRVTVTIVFSKLINSNIPCFRKAKKVKYISFVFYEH